MEGKIFAVGDLHGALDRLRALLDKLDVDNERDRLVFLGDYLGRGADSVEVIDFLIELQQSFPHTIFLKGDHEALFRNHRIGLDRISYPINGGGRTLRSYAGAFGSDASTVPPAHDDFFDGLRLLHQTERYLFVHAGIRPQVPLSMQNSWDLLWIRTPFIEDETDFGRRVIFGHTPFSEPLVMFNKIGIDTGAGHGRRLTCVVLPEVEFVSA